MVSVPYIATEQTQPLRECQTDGARHPFDAFIIAKTPAERWGNRRIYKGQLSSLLQRLPTLSMGISYMLMAEFLPISANNLNKEMRTKK